jgi:hypothetical protein
MTGHVAEMVMRNTLKICEILKNQSHLRSNAWFVTDSRPNYCCINS